MDYSDKKEPTDIYYVTQKKDGDGWTVKRGNASKNSAVCKTKEEAVKKAKELAKNSNATIMIKKRDGSHQETISYKK